MNGYEQMQPQGGQSWGQGGYQPQFRSPVQVDRQDPRANQYAQPQYNQQPYGDQQMNFQPSYFMQAPLYQPNQYGARGQDNTTLVKVLSEAEAQSYLVARGNSVAMIDAAGKKLFVKSVDLDGCPSFERYALIPEHDTEPQKTEQKEERAPAVEYVTRGEYEELKQDHDRLIDIIKKLTERVMEDGTK